MKEARYLTLAQANDYFGLSQQGFSVKWWYAHWRQIRGCFKIGGSVLVDREMVEEYFKELVSRRKPANVKSGRDDNRHGLLS